MDNGWNASATAWIAHMENHIDFARPSVLDAPMLARIRDRGFRRGLDVGCGEGRFCRMMRDLGIAPIGIDPTQALLDQATRVDPQGNRTSK